MPSRNAMTHYGKPAIGIFLALISIAGLVLGLGGEAFRQTYANLTIVLMLHWFAILYLIWLAFDFRSASFALPRVKSVQLEEGVLLVSRKEWLGMGVAVLIFRQDGDYERLLASGEVVNIQENGLVQIGLHTPDLDHDDTERLRNRLTSAPIDRLIVKPGQIGTSQ
jgi:hypothetical protein